MDTRDIEDSILEAHQLYISEHAYKDSQIESSEKVMSKALNQLSTLKRLLSKSLELNKQAQYAMKKGNIYGTINDNGENVYLDCDEWIGDYKSLLKEVGKI